MLDDVQKPKLVLPHLGQGEVPIIPLDIVFYLQPLASGFVPILGYQGLRLSDDRADDTAVGA